MIEPSQCFFFFINFGMELYFVLIKAFEELISRSNSFSSIAKSGRTLTITVLGCFHLSLMTLLGKLPYLVQSTL